MVDWSASRVPTRGADSVWIAQAAVRRSAADEPVVVETVNPSTRHEAAELIAELVERTLAADETLLLGLDVSLGYPRGFAAATADLRAPGRPPWRGTWELLVDRVHDGPDNDNDRFAAADAINRETGTRLFWGRPQSPAYADLAALPPTDRVPEGLAPNPCPPLRLAERRAGAGIRSAFQLLGAGTVGGQTLVGIPWLDRLWRRWPAAAVWPFETGFVEDPLVPGRSVVAVEIWPSAFDVDHSVSTVKDEAQVVSTVRAMAAQQALGWGSWFAPPTVLALDPPERAACDEEGWILGVL